MTKRTMNVVKGIASGAAAGMLIGFAGKSLTENRGDLKKKASRAMSTMSDIIDSVSSALK